ncbi:hypothetical protein DJ90_6304 [Paenibacillus macerans]|uniref:Uncharacterized protein n=1 Tax=Paenibacillus macerans TaxID=44252 RepID=A0A090YC21_PAEMA|nr:hypothetical protein DJ90_6304 [Paenibacillus macerans]
MPGPQQRGDRLNSVQASQPVDSERFTSIGLFLQTAGNRLIVKVQKNNGKNGPYSRQKRSVARIEDFFVPILVRWG